MNELLQTHFPAAAEFSPRHLFFKQRDLIFLKAFQQFGNTPVCVEPLLAGSVRSIIILQESPHQWVRSMEHCTGQRSRDTFECIFTPKTCIFWCDWLKCGVI